VQTIDAILSRRSIRRFTDECIPQDNLVTILKCACAAPSAMNNQPWYFLVITQKETLLKIASFHPYASMMKEATVAIVILLREPENSSRMYMAQDASACIQNILLAAHDLGYGAVWLGVYPHKERMAEAQKHLEIPDEFTPFAVVALGVPKEEKGPRNNYQENRVFWESFK